MKTKEQQKFQVDLAQLVTLGCHTININRTVKAWGVNLDIKSGLHNASVAFAKINVGRNSSIHMHPSRNNGFVVMRGILTLKIFDGTREVQIKLKENRDIILVVQPKVRHQFLAETYVELLEVYFDDLNSQCKVDCTTCDQDIVRDA